MTLFAACLLTFLLGALASLLPRSFRAANALGSGFAALGCLLGLVPAVQALASPQDWELILYWPPPWGLGALGLDGISALFLTPAQRRQAADAEGGHQEGRSSGRHAFEHAAQLVHAAFARAMQHAARAEEQQGFEHSVVHHVDEGRAEAQRRHQGRVVGPAQGPEAQAKEHQPGVLHA